MGIYVLEQHTAPILSHKDGGSTFFHNTGTHLQITQCHTTEKQNTDAATPAMKLDSYKACNYNETLAHSLLRFYYEGSI